MLLILLRLKKVNDLSSDLKTQSAVARQLGIIGKTLNELEIPHPEQSLDNSLQGPPS